MQFLLDANCLLRIARQRDLADDVERLLSEVPHDRLRISDFGLHSIAITMAHFGQLADYPGLVHRVGIGETIAIVRLFPTDWPRVVEVVAAHRLDVDDAYQYVAAEIDHRRLVSFDRDFDRTPNGRVTPAAALQMFKDEPT